MNWWNDLIDWLTSTAGQRVITGVVVPFVAIVVAGVVAGLIARGMSKRLLDSREREVKAHAVTALISSARRSIEWSTLSPAERAHTTHLSDEATMRLRLLPVTGADLAAIWSEHEIDSIRENSATFRFQAEQTFADLRDRLVQWQAKPARAKKLFRDDVERWATEKGDAQASPSSLAAPTVQSSVPADVQASPVPSTAVFAPAPVVPATPPAAAAQDAAVAAMEQAPAAQAPAAQAPAAQAPAAQASAAQASGSSEAPSQSGAGMSGAGADPSVSTGVPARESTGMVTTPVVSAPAPSSPAIGGTPAPNAAERAAEPADSESRDDESGDDREPAFSAPVSAHQVRRRTTPDEN